ncbi:MAG: hypothetical protein ACRD4O_06085 [Bryobacteraceae bacterium]
MISRLCLLPLLGCAVCWANDNPSEILQRIDAKVLGHLAKTVNYTCVETVERMYFKPTVSRHGACPTPQAASRLKLTARDRLRLDVAVAQGNEMYSWHADHKFSSTLIGSIVRRGPIGSGGFVGFLENVFGEGGVEFRFKGRETEGAAEVFSFEYTVPLSVSHYEVQSGKQKSLVPFHGSFLAYAGNYELASMTVIADNIPKSLGICSSRSGMTYQLITIAGNELLLPRVWTLGLATPAMLTESDSEYTACREFTGQATISYKNLATTSPESDTKPAQPPQELPAGLTLRIRLRTPIDGQHSFAGDPVRGELLRSVSAGRHRKRIPRGAMLYGVITRLEDCYEPSAHYLLDIEFERMRSGERTFVLRARPKPLPSQMERLHWMYGTEAPLPADLAEAVKRGLFVFPSKRLQLGENFSAYWETEPVTATH